MMNDWVFWDSELTNVRFFRPSLSRAEFHAGKITDCEFENVNLMGFKLGGPSSVSRFTDVRGTRFIDSE